MTTFTAAIKDFRSLNALIRRPPLLYNHLRRLQEGFSNVDIAEKRQLVRERLISQLTAAAKTAYGRNLNSGLELTHWPYLEKTEISKDPRRFFSKTWGPSVAASTSGTSGIPLKLRRSLVSVVFEQICIDSLFQAAEIDAASARIAILRGDTIKNPNDMSPPFWRCDKGRTRLRLSAHHLSSRTITDYVDILQRFRPHCMMAYPSALELLSMLLESRNIKLEIPLIMTSSEVLTEKARALALRTVGGKLVDHYGQAERVAFAYSWGTGYYFLPFYGLVELDLVTNENELDIFEIIATSLWNQSMPLVRYRTGDRIGCPRGLSDTELGNICSGLRSFDKIDGRQSDYLISPDGGRLIGINQIPRGLEKIVRLQFIQETRKQVNVLVIPREGFSDSDLDLLNRNLFEKIPKKMDVHIELVERVELTGEAKAPFIIRRPGVEG